MWSFEGDLSAASPLLTTVMRPEESGRGTRYARAPQNAACSARLFALRNAIECNEKHRWWLSGREITSQAPNPPGVYPGSWGPRRGLR